VVALALLAAACGDDDGTDDPLPLGTAPPTTVAQGPTTAVPELTPLEVELLLPGEAPRQPLVHDVAAGTVWNGDLAFTLAVDTVADVSVATDNRLDQRAVAADGTISTGYALTGLDLTLNSTDGAAAEVDDALTISGQLLVGPDRTVEEATVETEVTDPSLPPAVRSFASALDPRLTTLLLPFPAQPVGPGGEWLISGPIPFFGNQVVLSTRAALIRRDAETFQLDLAVSMTTPDDSGNDIELSGLGQLVGRFDTLGPTSGRISLEGTISLPDRSPAPLPMRLDLEVTGT